MKKKIVLTGGGTAGHVYPALAIKENLPKEYEVFYIGSDGMEKEIVKKEKDVKYFEIQAVKLERRLTLKNFLIPFKLLSSIKNAKKILKEINPDVIFSKGGFVALPVVIAGKKLNIPVISHESDLSMGLANKIICHYCDVMCTSFEETKGSDKIVYTGQPIRKNILKGNKNNVKFDKNVKNNKKNLLIVGGSSGAGFLNNLVYENIDALTNNFNVVHVTGKGKAKKISNYENYIQIEYAYNMGDLLDYADIVLSRAGSGAINEFLAMKKPMLLIPLSKSCSRGDQIENAKLFFKNGYAEMIQEETYSSALLLEKLDILQKNYNKYVDNMKKSKSNDACEKIVALISDITK